MLKGRTLWPSELDGCARPAVTWEYSHGLRSGLAEFDESGAPAMAAFLPEAARDAVLTAVRAQFTDNVFLDWLESIGEVPELQRELGEIPSAFEALYVNRGIVIAAG